MNQNELFSLFFSDPGGSLSVVRGQLIDVLMLPEGGLVQTGRRHRSRTNGCFPMMWQPTWKRKCFGKVEAPFLFRLP